MASGHGSRCPISMTGAQNGHHATFQRANRLMIIELAVDCSVVRKPFRDIYGRAEDTTC
jgi:hypothetical protein